LALIALAALPGFIIGTVRRTSTVIAEGDLVPGLDNYPVQQVEWLGVRFFVDISGGVSDSLTAMTLCAGGAVALMGALLLARSPRDTRTSPTALGVIGMVLVWMATDELLGFHETVGHNLSGVRNFPIIDQPDDLLVVVGFVLLVAVVLWLRPRLALDRAGALPLLAAGVVLAIAAVADFVPGFPFEPVEEPMEILGVGLVLVSVTIGVIRALEAGTSGCGARDW
jgi:hypothetical protein